MRVQPREQMLEIWRAVARFSQRDGEWTWGGRDGRNSISDAEQVLCLLYPATEVPNLQLSAPDATADDVQKALKLLGDSREIPQLLIDVIGDYMTTYTSPTGKPIFAGGSYFTPFIPGDELADEQRNLDVVDSFATSLSLTLSTLSFLKVFSRYVRRAALRSKISELEEITSKRLSAAMVGLLRSFSINVFKPDSLEGRSLCRMLNQQKLPDQVVLENLGGSWSHFAQACATPRLA